MARSNLTFSCDFETSADISAWPTAVGRLSIATNYALEGSGSCRVEVKNTDAMIAEGARSELNLSESAKPDSATYQQWFGFAQLLDPTWVDENDPNLTDITSQWHSSSGNPPIAFGVSNKQWYVQSKIINSGKIFNLGAITKGVWYRIVFHINWSTTTSGLIEIWINDVKLGSWSGITYPAGQDAGPFWKTGIYKWPWNTGDGELKGVGSNTTDRLLYIDAVRVGNGSATYADVVPGTSVSPTPAPVTPTPPAVSAGSAQSITLPTSQANLAGSATTATGSIKAILWSQISGPVAAGIVSPGSTATVIKSLVAGSYVFNMKATNSDNLTANANVSVVVNAAPVPSAKNIVSVSPYSSGFWFWTKQNLTINYSDGSKVSVTGIKSYTWNSVARTVFVTFTNGSTRTYS